MKTTSWHRSVHISITMLFWLALTTTVCAEDLLTLSGVTYRQARMVRVEPDGVTWTHSTGMCKVDFTDLPESVCKQYHYSPAKAAAYKSAQISAQQQASERMQKDREALKTWQSKQLQQKMEISADLGPNTFIYRRRSVDIAAVETIESQIEKVQRARDLLTKDDGTVWDRRLWAVPCLLVGGGYNPGIAFDPHVNLNDKEFQGSLHGMGEAFFTPIYMTKSYYQDVDRATAFARGYP